MKAIAGLLQAALWKVYWTVESVVWPSKYKLHSDSLKCPKCEDINELYRNVSVYVSEPIEVDENGQYLHNGGMDSEVHWETLKHRKVQREPEFQCNRCSIAFDAPNVMRGD